MKVPGKYVLNRESALKALLEKPRSRYTPGTFHQLRVEIKKLHALIDLLKYCSKDFDKKKTIKPFKLIFRQAGNVRELQLEEALLKKFQVNESLSDYLTNLRNRRLNEKDQFFILVNEETKHQLSKRFRKLSSLLSDIKNKKVIKYLQKKINNINKLITKSTLQPEQLHELRKNLKMLNYNRKSLSIEQSLDQKKDVLPVLLGKWHDLEVMGGHLQNTIATGSLKRKEIVQLEKIITVMSSESDMLLEKIIKAIPKSEFFEVHNSALENTKKVK